MASRKKAEPKETPAPKAPRKSPGGLMSAEARDAEVARFAAVPRDVRAAQLDHLAYLIKRERYRKLTFPTLPEFAEVVARHRNPCVEDAP